MTLFVGVAIQLGQGKSRRGRKEDRRLGIPFTTALRGVLDAAPRRATIVLARADGSAWTKSTFHKAWTEAYRDAGPKGDLHDHDLRGTAVTMLAEAGCTPQETATITGRTLATVNRIWRSIQPEPGSWQRAPSSNATPIRETLSENGLQNALQKIGSAAPSGGSNRFQKHQPQQCVR